MLRILLLVGFGLLFAITAVTAQGLVPRDMCIEVAAAPHPSDTGLVFTWPQRDSVLTTTVHRRVRGTGNWIGQDTLGPADTTWSDATVLPGQAYEYRLIRTQQVNNVPGTNNTTQRGYLYAGRERHLWPVQQRVLLLIDSTYIDSLAPEFNRLEQDLQAEGWRTLRLYVGRTQAPSQVRNQIIDLYAVYPDLRGVFILGHVPVPYSGNYGPDAHSDHQGAWPADVYYGELNATTWTDATVNTTTASRPENDNIPNDGKFDQSDLNQLATSLELWVGRADFFNLPAFAQSDTALLRNYLNKDHAFRTGQNQLPRRAVVEDNFGWFSGEAFSYGGLTNWIAVLGRDSVKNMDFDSLKTQPYLCSYGTGGGSYTSAGGIVSTSAFANDTFNTVFMFIFGSYHGDWDSQNNLMRAAIASGPYTLTCGWSGRPHWYMHPLALGECFGQALITSQLNSGSISSGYAPAGFSNRGLHQNLMGDPTLRLFYVQPPTNLVAVADTDSVTLAWQPSPDAQLNGYHIFRTQWPDSNYVRITDEPVLGTTYIDTTLDTTATYAYRVFAARLETTASGTWWNLSQGIWDSVTVPVRVQTTDTTNATTEPLAASVRAFPNPASEALTLHFTLNTAAHTTLELVEPTGRVVLRRDYDLQPAGQQRRTVPVADLPAGLYLWRLTAGTSTHTGRVVVQ